MHIFIDESGDLGFDFSRSGTSDHFIITAAVIPDRELNSVHTAVRRTLRNKLNVRKKRHGELKGTAMPRAARRYFWRQLSGVDFRLYVAVLKKRPIHSGDRALPQRIYRFLIRSIIEQLPFDAPDSRIQVAIDRSRYTGYQREFNASLQSDIEGRVPPWIPVFIDHQSSHDNKGVQMADVFCWGLLRKYRDADEEWYSVFQDRIAFEELYSPVADDDPEQF